MAIDYYEKVEAFEREIIREAARAGRSLARVALRLHNRAP